jgi:hypothetical protein
MKTSSAKAKGRKCATEVQQLLLKYSQILQSDDVRVTPSGMTGEDILLSPAARLIYPFAIECKNQEALNIWAAYEQAKEHAVKTNYTPIVFYKRNRSELMVTLKAEDFINLLWNFIGDKND